MNKDEEYLQEPYVDDFLKQERLSCGSKFSGWAGLSKSKMEFCYCDAIPRKVKKSVIKALEERNTEDAQKMANLLKSIEVGRQPSRMRPKKGEDHGTTKQKTSD